MNTRTKKIVMTAMMAALVWAATTIIRIPSPLKGYLNLGDCVVLATGWILSPTYAFLAAGLGSAMADLFSGYILYAPATFVIKGCMASIAFYSFTLLHAKLGILPSRIASGLLAEIIMILGYYTFEGFMYGFVLSAINIPANAMQGMAGLVIGIVLMEMLTKNKTL